MLLFGLYQFILWFQTLPITLPSPWGQFERLKIQSIPPSPSQLYFCNKALELIPLFDFFDFHPVFIHLFLLFLLIITRSGFLAGIKGSLCTTKFQRIQYVSFSWRESLLLLLLLLMRVFRITGVWVTTSRLKSPGLFSVFWPFSIMLLFGWSPLGH